MNFALWSRIHDSPHLGTRQYARTLEGWVEELGLDPEDYGTHSIRRTKAAQNDRRTKNLRPVQLLLGHWAGATQGDGSKTLRLAAKPDGTAPDPCRLVTEDGV